VLKIVGDNVTRVNRMVEDILQLSRKAQPHSEPLALDVFLAELRAEFIDTHSLAPEIVGVTVAPGTLVRFDALHLREVVLNLLNNAVRYASGGRPRSASTRCATRRSGWNCTCRTMAPAFRPKCGPTCSSRFTPPPARAPGWGCIWRGNCV
jgi:signal transduction histidine kinase